MYLGLTSLPEVEKGALTCRKQAGVGLEWRSHGALGRDSGRTPVFAPTRYGGDLNRERQRD